jgi:hypothetical protein
MVIERYDHTEQMARCLDAIRSARALLAAHLDQPEDWHGVIRHQVMAAVVHYSTAIEGNILTRDQVESIIAGEAIEVPEKDRVEALTTARAMGADPVARPRLASDARDDPHSALYGRDRPRVRLPTTRPVSPRPEHGPGQTNRRVHLLPTAPGRGTRAHGRVHRLCTPPF